MKKDFKPITKSKAFDLLKRDTISLAFIRNNNNTISSNYKISICQILDSVREVIYFEKKSWLSRSVWASLPEKDLFGPAETVAEQIAELRFKKLLTEGDF